MMVEGSNHRYGASDAPGRRTGGDEVGSGRLAAYLAVALASLIIGAGSMLLALRSGPAARAKTSAPDTPSMPATSSASPGAGAVHPTQAGGKVVYVSPARQQVIGVRTATVTSRTLAETIRTVGTLAYDET